MLEEAFKEASKLILLMGGAYILAGLIIFAGAVHGMKQNLKP